jgi:hypothetical protein
MNTFKQIGASKKVVTEKIELKAWQKKIKTITKDATFQTVDKDGVMPVSVAIASDNKIVGYFAGIFGAYIEEV